tara:strand:- start:4696 stop:5496 length:801 start_codon:yes stop_codon:yes gene_type:complete
MNRFDLSAAESPTTNEYETLTYYTELPSQGKLYPPNHPLHNVTKIELKMMTTKEEDILTNASYIEEGVIFEKFLKSVIVDKKLDPSDLFDGDQTAILYAARQEAYGDEYVVGVECNACSHHNEEKLSLSDKVLSEGSREDVELTPDSTMVVTLPKGDKTVEYRHLTPKQLRTIDKAVEAKKKHGIETSPLQELYLKIILSVDGETNKGKIAEYIASMPIRDSRYLKQIYYESAPQVKLEYSTECDKCKKLLEGGVPIQANFFWPDL